MEDIELRWFTDDDGNRSLQYRVKPGTDVQPWWQDWIDVPEVTAEEERQQKEKERREMFDWARKL